MRLFRWDEDLAIGLPPGIVEIPGIAEGDEVELVPIDESRLGTPVGPRSC